MRALRDRRQAAVVRHRRRGAPGLLALQQGVPPLRSLEPGQLGRRCSDRQPEQDDRRTCERGRPRRAGHSPRGGRVVPAGAVLIRLVKRERLAGNVSIQPSAAPKSSQPMPRMVAREPVVRRRVLIPAKNSAVAKSRRRGCSGQRAEHPPARAAIPPLLRLEKKSPRLLPRRRLRSGIAASRTASERRLLRYLTCYPSLRPPRPAAESGRTRIAKKEKAVQLRALHARAPDQSSG